MNAVGSRQRSQHQRLLDEVRTKARGCITLVAIAAMHEPSLIVSDGYVLCGQCRSTWPCQTVQTIQTEVSGDRTSPTRTRADTPDAAASLGWAGVKRGR